MAVVGLLCALSLAQEDAAGVRREVEAVFRKWEALAARRDSAGMAALMHPSGYTVALDGTKWPFSRAARDLPGMFLGTRYMRMKISIDHFHYGAGEAVAWITTRTTFEEKAGRVWVKRTSVRRDADTLRKFGREWKFVFSQVLP